MISSMIPLRYYPFLAGGLSGILFSLTISGALSGFLVWFLPMLPIFLAGFRFGFQAVIQAIALGATTVLLLTGSASLLLYMIFPATSAGLLSWCFLQLALVPNAGLIWYPVGRALSLLVVYLAAVFLAAGMVALQHKSGGLAAALQQGMSIEAKGLDSDLKLQVEELTQNFGFIIYALILWVWVIFSYATAILASFACMGTRGSFRQGLRLQPFLPPIILWPLLLATAIPMFASNPNIAIVGKALFLLLLLPWFLAGAAHIHAVLRQSPQGKNWLFAFYILLFIGQWPSLLMVTLYGMYCQIRIYIKLAK